MACGAARDIEANGLRLRLHEWGLPGKTPALLLHSLAAHSHWWDWSAPLLAERFSVAALDLRGHGGSGWSDPPAYRPTDYAADIVAVLDLLGWRSPLVIGHSLGGYVGAYLAARHPDRVGALVITDTMTQWSEDEAAWALKQVERPDPEFANPSEAGTRYRLSPPETKAPADWIRHLGEAAVVERKPGVWQYAFDRCVFAQAPPDAWPLLPGVVCPTLVVRGEGSRIMDRDAWLRVATAVQRGQFAEVKDAWHHLILDDPAAFCSIVTTWFDRMVTQSPAGGRWPS
jgi:pimeloyl-ACP methyl ester carboxylesterase